MIIYYLIIIYTDGSSHGNPGPGGISFILIYISYNIFLKKEYSYLFEYSTNNRMELYAIIFAIKKIKIKNYLYIYIYSDSKYIINIINNNYKIKKNLDLWKEFLIINKSKIKFNWIKGHNNNYYNEICNKLAQRSIVTNKIVFKDNYYENIKNINIINI
ncbi:MAG: reverse transcriptase-like protein [Candidatus Shikimatogenerans bostrichidophilus]|nr:MAG: reverse transcriptase-like protein [Candidatus Shikimatogenerans bostrichidophilus]